MNQTPMPEIVPANAAGIGRAARLLQNGGLVAVPTETVYGLAARADSSDAVAAIYRAKGRPDFNPLIVHIATMEQAMALAHFNPCARMLAQTFWPGPLTLVLPLREGANIAPAVTAGLPTIALRMPAHKAMRELLAMADLPLAAPSANISGGVSPTQARHVAASLGMAVPLIIDGGPCVQGLESTIVAPRDFGWQMLRPGPIEKQAISDICGDALAIASAKVEAPGQLASHYAPGKPMRLDARHAQPGEYHIGFGDIAGDCNLSPDGDLAQAAARLYACLHQAAGAAAPRIAVAPVPGDGIGEAINDRLRRAAA